MINVLLVLYHRRFRSVEKVHWCNAKGQQTHKAQKLHLDSSAKYKAYIETKLSQKTISSLLNDDHRQFVKRNCEYIKIIVDTLRLMAVQNIAQPGHRESNVDADENRGNFLEILNFLKNYCEILQENTANNAKYTHHRCRTLSWRCSVR